MMRSCAAYSASGSAEKHRHFEAAIGDVMDCRGLLDNLAHCFESEIEKDDIDDRMAAGKCGSNTDASLRAFGDRRIANSLFAEFIPEAPALLEISSSRSNALTDVKDIRIPTHLLADALDTCLGIRNDPVGLIRKNCRRNASRGCLTHACSLFRH